MKLFLDDVRVPSDCIGYMPMRIGGNAVIYHSIDWVIVRDHYQFINWITKNGLPNLISFDHDLSDEHYSPLMYTSEDQYQEAIEGTAPTGYDSAKWLIEYCIENNQSLPEWVVHSMNPIGVDRIQNILINFEKYANK
jgi:hypothetical protein